MNATTRKAVLGSVEKWEAIVASPEALDLGPRNCPLCFKFFGNECKGCPVANQTGQHGCLGTPYERWAKHHIAAHGRFFVSIHREPGCKTCMKEAREEVAFLKGLLPKARKPGGKKP